MTFVLGARGTFRDFHDWEAIYTYSNYEFESSLPWFLWRPLIDEMLGVYFGVNVFGEQL